MTAPPRPLPEDLLAEGEALVRTDLALPWGHRDDRATAEAGKALQRRIEATDRPHVVVDFRGRENIHDVDLARCIEWFDAARNHGGRLTVPVDAGGVKIVDFIRPAKVDRILPLRVT
jgi:hypothetical protein